MQVKVMKEVGKGIVESGYSMDELRDVKRFRPNALKLMSEDGKREEFTVGLIPDGGAIGSAAIFFGEETEDGHAKVVFDVPQDIEQEKLSRWMMDKFGTAFIQLAKVERQIAGALTEVAADKENIERSIILG